MSGFSNLALVALAAQYLLFRGYLTVAFRHARRRGKLPSAHLTSRWELRGKSFEILGLAFIGFIVSTGFWGHGVDGERLIGGLLWAIFAGRTISLVWTRGAIRRLGYLLSLVPIIVMVGLGGVGAVLQWGWMREEVRSEAVPPQDKTGSGGYSSKMQMASAGDKPGASYVGTEGETVVPPAAGEAAGLRARASDSASSQQRNLDDAGALDRICRVFPLDACTADADRTLRLRLEVALAEVAGTAQLPGLSDAKVLARNLLLSLAETNNAPSEYRAGKFFQQASQLERAVPLYRKAHDSGYGAATYELARHLGDSEESVRLFELAMRQGYDNALTRGALAEALLRRGDASECKRIRDLIKPRGESPSSALGELTGTPFFLSVCGAK